MLREAPLYFMLLPAVIIVLIYSYGPMFGLIMAFQRFTLGGGFFRSEMIGFDNFTRMFALPNIWNVIRNTVVIALGKMAGGIIVPVAFALLLNEIGKVLLKRVFQTMVYLPNFLSWIILAGVFKDMLSPSQGIVNQLLSGVGIKPIFFLGDKFWFPITMIVTDIWKGFGFGSIIYLAALTGIDPALYESAKIDGANRWKQTLYITLPGIKSIVVLMTVLSMGGILNGGFDQIFNMYNSSVMATGDILDTLVYRMGIENTQYSMSTAAGLFKSVVSLGFILMSYYLADKWAGYRIF
jgi:putative aldouronate transport system permease protein